PAGVGCGRLTPFGRTAARSCTAVRALFLFAQGGRSVDLSLCLHVAAHLRTRADEERCGTLRPRCGLDGRIYLPLRLGIRRVSKRHDNGPWKPVFSVAKREQPLPIAADGALNTPLQLRKALRHS